MLTDRYAAEFAGSKARYEQARTVFPAGVTHDLRHMEPFPIFVDRQVGSRKWDVDGHELIDYWSGHGSMLLGHSHPDVVAAVQKQMERGTHAGGCHDLEVEWGRMVINLIPSAEKVRFTGSGTEATLMALRLARIHTGRPRFLKFAGHFHGWHDSVAVGADAPYDNLTVPGIPESVASNTVVIPPNDHGLLEHTLKTDPTIAAVILEPTGGHWGAVPIRGEFLKTLRELTTKHGQLLIFDEVITGFRVSPGGAQERYGIKPDLTSLAKILAGGLPGGALVGRADVLDVIDFRPGKPKMRHPGTYNGNPLSAAAGIAALKHVATGEPGKRANETGRQLRNRLNRLFAKNNWPWAAYLDFSMFRLIPNYQGPRPGDAAGDNDGLIPYEGDLNKLDGPPANPKLRHLFRQGMLLAGVDLPGLAGWIMATHTEDDVVKTVKAVETTIAALMEEGAV
ncbi:aspartate aminotransferase family protein [Zavarzinella formosa]|uniref:aspartate aminotransferase family protein n=1 Tax=Zavarzinella formosa TaxID=360055 RepID=UPI0002F2CC5B|nr:aspartate aminotransferase family protein [Zavarzinella formosa]